jgi:hypothetical protein
VRSGGLIWRPRAPDGRELKITLEPGDALVWVVEIQGHPLEHRSRHLRRALADASGDDFLAPWIIALEDQLHAYVRDRLGVAAAIGSMEGYKVVTTDGRTVGRVVSTVGEYVIVEHGRLRKSRHPIPTKFTHPDEERRRLRVTLSKEIVLDAPRVGARELDERAAALYYGLDRG